MIRHSRAGGSDGIKHLNSMVEISTTMQVALTSHDRQGVDLQGIRFLIGAARIVLMEINYLKPEFWISPVQ
jgi:hypothetical protein